MSDWLVGLAGTPEGARLAAGLALLSALAHAVFGALQKGRHDPWISRGAIDVGFFSLSLPAVLLVPPPRGSEWALLAGCMVIHFAYKLAMALAYERAAYSVVYPVVRGTGPLFTVAFATVWLAEPFTAVQWAGVILLSGAIVAIAGVNLAAGAADPRTLRTGLGWAVAGGLLVALYTTYDAWAIRRFDDPFAFLAWFFLLTALDMPLIAALRWRRLPSPPPLGPLMLRGLVGALTGFVSFGGVMLGTRIGTVGEVAALRETSTVFAALIAWAVLGERVGPARAALMGLIAAGAVVVQVGG